MKMQTTALNADKSILALSSPSIYMFFVIKLTLTSRFICQAASFVSLLSQLLQLYTLF